MAMIELRTHAELVGALLERDAEIVRLRKALKEIEARCSFQPLDLVPADVARLARAALEEPR